MSDPARLLQGSLPTEARQALEAGKLLVPPPHAAPGVLSALAPVLREGATLKAVAGIKTATAIKGAAIGMSGALKLAGVVSVVGGAALAAAVAGRAPQPDRAPVAAPRVVSEVAAASSPATPIEIESLPSAGIAPSATPAPVLQAHPSETVSQTTSAAPARPAPASSIARADEVAAPLDADAAVASHVSTLRAESSMILRARTALRNGDAAGALEVLRQGERLFPGGALYEEREALMVEGLLAAGQRAAAIRRGQAFLQHHSGSAHASRIRPLVEGVAP